MLISLGYIRISIVRVCKLDRSLRIRCRLSHVLQECLEVKSTHLVNLFVELLQLLVLEEDRLDLVLELVAAEVKCDQELFVFTEEVVKDA